MVYPRLQLASEKTKDSKPEVFTEYKVNANKAEDAENDAWYDCLKGVQAKDNENKRHCELSNSTWKPKEIKAEFIR